MLQVRVCEYAPALEMNLTSSFLFLSDQLEYVVHLPLFCIITVPGFPEAVGLREESEFSSRPCSYSGEASIFRFSPSSRSESAMLSADS